MKKFGRSAIAYIQKWVSTLFSAGLVLFYSRWFVQNKLKKLPANTDVLILANGPSLQKDIERYKLHHQEFADIFVLNDFCLSELFESLQPKLYIINDPAYWTKNQEHIEQGVRTFFQTINKKVSWSLVLFVPYSGYKKLLPHITNKFIRVIPFNNTPVDGFRSFNFYLYDRNLGVPQLQNVLVGAIYLSVLMKYKNVKLMGVDHDWHKRISVDKNNFVVWQNHHFYDSLDETNQPMRICNGEDFFDMQQIFKALSVTHRSYKVLADYASARQVEIINYTRESCIDSFKRFIE